MCRVNERGVDRVILGGQVPWCIGRHGRACAWSACYRRQLGQVVATTSTGHPWDHVDDVQNAQRGLVNRIRQLTRQRGGSRIWDADRSALRADLSEASHLLD